ncbi:MAG: S24 family peptidase [Ahrensia sp.]|nr:S24 family peptidase [Ahrensia sp.]
MIKQSTDQRGETPVLGTAAGSPIGTDILSNEPLEYVKCPPGLVGVRDAYMLWVNGSSMAPKFENGEPLFINPHRPVRQNDYVVVQVFENGGLKALVKRFIRDSEHTVELEQFNPPAKISIKKEQVHRIHRILTATEIAGI